MSGTVRITRPDGIGRRDDRSEEATPLTEVLHVRLTPSDVEHLNILAALDRREVSWLVRSLIRAHVISRLGSGS